MKKLLKSVWIAVILFALLCSGILLKDKAALRDDLIRLHVVANSDSQNDQRIKLMVKDAVVDYLNGAMEGIQDAQQAKEFISSDLPEIESVANAALKKAGSPHTATAKIALEEYDTRTYDTFTLPAGVYNSLRIQIGEASGQNWWCVVFPSLCIPKTTKEFADKAVSAGFDQGLTDTLSGKPKYQFRFFLLDCFGKLENMFRKG